MDSSLSLTSVNPVMVHEKYVHARELRKESSVSLIFVDAIMVDEKCVKIWETE